MSPLFWPLTLIGREAETPESNVDSPGQLDAPRREFAALRAEIRARSLDKKENNHDT
jgi:hypothetical protein